MAEETRQIIRDYILSEFLVGEESKNLTDDLDLRKTGILNSLAMVEFVDFIQTTFQIELEVNEGGAKNFATIERIVSYVERKVAAAKVSSQNRTTTNPPQLASLQITSPPMPPSG